MLQLVPLLVLRHCDGSVVISVEGICTMLKSSRDAILPLLRDTCNELLCRMESGTGVMRRLAYICTLLLTSNFWLREMMRFLKKLPNSSFSA